jgi:predicted 2-oxoglutarate/Fe(II)-dependent dioxygenase YbiX
VLTVLVYLNDGFEGGETLVHEPTLAIIEPKAGSVLLLKQDVLHEGRPVVRGVKYLLRGDAMCDDPKRVSK